MSYGRAVRRWLGAQLPGPGIAYLVLFVNTKCEQDCAHCFVRAERDDNLIRPDELEAVGKHLPHLTQLTVTGGEPTLRKDFSEAVAAIANASGVPFVSVHTNGFVPDRIEKKTGELLDWIPDAQISMRLSLDGFGDLHDKIRRRPGSWERAAESLERLQKLRRQEPRLRIFTDTCLSKYNEQGLDELAEFLDAQADQMDGRELLFLRGDPRDPGSAGVTAATYRAALARFSPELSQGGRGEVGFSLPESARRSVYRQILSVAEGHGRAAGCVAGWRFAVLGSSGEVSACEVPGGGGILGNVRSDGPDIQAILGKGKGAAAREHIRSGACAEGCSYECAALATIALRGTRLAQAVADTTAPSEAQ